MFFLIGTVDVGSVCLLHLTLVEILISFLGASHSWKFGGCLCHDQLHLSFFPYPRLHFTVVSVGNVCGKVGCVLAAVAVQEHQFFFCWKSGFEMSMDSVVPTTGKRCLLLLKIKLCSNLCCSSFFFFSVFLEVISVKHVVIDWVQKSQLHFIVWNVCIFIKGICFYLFF